VPFTNSSRKQHGTSPDNWLRPALDDLKQYQKQEAANASEDAASRPIGFSQLCWDLIRVRPTSNCILIVGDLRHPEVPGHTSCPTESRKEPGLFRVFPKQARDR
jgi:hypothetical protein